MPTASEIETYHLDTKKFLGVCAFVILMHFLLLAWFISQKESFKVNMPVPRLVVQTVSLDKPTTQLPTALQPTLLEESLLLPETVILTEEHAEVEVIKTPPKIEEKMPERVPKLIKEEKPAPLKVEKVIPTTPKAAPKKPVPIVKPEVKKTLPKVEEKKSVVKPKTIEKPAAKETTPAKVDTAKAEAVAKAEQNKKLAAEAAAAKKKKLLAEANNNLKSASKPSEKAVNPANKIALAEPPKSLTLTIANPVNGISSGGLVSVNSLEVNYGQELANRLKRLLKLPQYGDVDVELTLSRSGKVTKLNVSNSPNAMNKEHVEKALPALVFPAFGNSFAGEEEHTFKIRLSNDLSRQ